MIILIFHLKKGGMEEKVALSLETINQHIQSFVVSYLKNWLIYREYIDSIGFSKYYPERKEFSLVFNGINIKPEDQKSKIFLQHAVSNIMQATALGNNFFLSALLGEPGNPNQPEKIFDCMTLLTEKTNREKRLEAIRFPTDRIPSHFQCIMTLQIMDIPVYLPEQPDRLYNRSHFVNWVMMQDKFIHPYTRVPVNLSTLKVNEKLKSEIEVFVSRSEYKAALKNKDYGMIYDSHRIEIQEEVDEKEKKSIMKKFEFLKRLSSVVGNGPTGKSLVEARLVEKRSSRSKYTGIFLASFAKFWLQHDICDEGFKDIQKNLGISFSEFPRF